MSRAKVRDNLLVMQAFSPALFGHGPPPGPDILMRLLRGDLARDQVEVEFDRLLEKKKLKGCETDLLAMPWECKVLCLGALTFFFTRATSYESITSYVYVLDAEGYSGSAERLVARRFC